MTRACERTYAARSLALGRGVEAVAELVEALRDFSRKHHELLNRVEAPASRLIVDHAERTHRESPRVDRHSGVSGKPKGIHQASRYTWIGSGVLYEERFFAAHDELAE